MPRSRRYVGLGRLASTDAERVPFFLDQILRGLGLEDVYKFL